MIDLKLDDDMLLPAYEGNSIVNIPSSVCRWLGTEGWPTIPLSDDFHAPWKKQYRQVILLVVDGMGLAMQNRFGSPEGKEGQAWQKTIDSGRLKQLTSIVPATTSAALTSFWTGLPPSQHGITGYEMWLREYNLSANMITQSPTFWQGTEGGLRDYGFQPESFLGCETLGPFLKQAGVETFVLQRDSIQGSGLSTMLFRQTRQVPFQALRELFALLEQIGTESSNQRRLLYAYWGDLDELQHRYGLADDRVRQGYRAFQSAFSRLIRRLRRSGNGNTLVVVTADHGQVASRPEPIYQVQRHPEFIQLLHMLPTGETRMPYLYVRPGCTEIARDVVESTWSNKFIVLDSDIAIEKGLFGAGPFHPELRSRVGDLILIAKEEAYLHWQYKENRLFGRHGGMSKAEMQVPLIMFEC